MFFQILNSPKKWGIFILVVFLVYIVLSFINDVLGANGYNIHLLEKVLF